MSCIINLSVPLKASPQCPAPPLLVSHRCMCLAHLICTRRRVVAAYNDLSQGSGRLWEFEDIFDVECNNSAPPVRPEGRSERSRSSDQVMGQLLSDGRLTGLSAPLVAGGDTHVGAPSLNYSQDLQREAGKATLVMLPRHSEALRLKLGVLVKGARPQDSPNERDRSS